MIIPILIVIIGYLLGSIPFSYIFAKLFKRIDIRKYGSKNAGASNVFFVAGPFAGVLALICDILKGSFAILLAQSLSMPEYIVILTGIAAIIGHCFPIFLKFKGGKGMATSIGVLIPLIPKELIISLVIFILFIIVIKRLALSGLIAISFLPFLAWYFNRSSILVIAVLLIVLSRWIIASFRFKEILKGSDYKKFIKKIK